MYIWISYRYICLLKMELLQEKQYFLFFHIHNIYSIQGIFEISLTLSLLFVFKNHPFIEQKSVHDYRPIYVCNLIMIVYILMLKLWPAFKILSTKWYRQQPFKYLWRTWPNTWCTAFLFTTVSEFLPRIFLLLHFCSMFLLKCQFYVFALISFHNHVAIWGNNPLLGSTNYNEN